jgi:hypothetical protein
MQGQKAESNENLYFQYFARVQGSRQGADKLPIFEVSHLVS